MARADKFNVNIQLIMTKVDKVKEEKYFTQFRAINEGNFYYNNRNQKNVAKKYKRFSFGMQYEDKVRIKSYEMSNSSIHLTQYSENDRYE